MPSGQEIFDPRTGFLSRAGLTSRFAELSNQARFTHQPVCLAICALDRFRLLTDWGGADIGDAVLGAIAAETRRHLRPFESIYHLGDGLFLIVLPGVDADEGASLAERLRSAVEQMSPQGLRLTLSVGVSAGRGHRVRHDTLLNGAEGALFAVERTGGNRVLCAPRDGIGPCLAEVSSEQVARSLA